MSDTTYVHEITQRRQLRVALTMDADECQALADIASAAIDAILLIEGDPESTVLGNATNVYSWATRAASTLERASGPIDDDKE
jgi:hypothetical protein